MLLAANPIPSLVMIEALGRHGCLKDKQAVRVQHHGGGQVGVYHSDIGCRRCLAGRGRGKGSEKLATVIPADAFELYVLTAIFLKSATQSADVPLPQRPSDIALRQDEEVNYALCALCLHPIGYYGDTWARCHVPDR